MADLTPEQAISKLRTLPEEQQRQVLQQLSPETRSGILKQLGQPGAGTGAGTGTAPGNPTDTVGPVPAWYTKAGLKEHGYRMARAVLDFLPTAGGIAGGIVGGGAGLETGPGAIATAGTGAAAGGVIGEDLKLSGERMIFPESKGWTPGPQTGKEVAKDLAIQGGVQGLSEVTGRVGSNLLTPFFKYMRETAAASKASGVRLLPSEAHGEAQGYIERFLKGSILTEGKMERFRVAQNDETKQAAQALATSIFSGGANATPLEIGKAVQQGIDTYTEAFRAQQNQMYGAIDAAVKEKAVQVPVKKTVGAGFLQQTKTVMKTELQGPAMPSTAGLKTFAKEQLKLLNQQEKILDPALLSSSRKMLETIANSPDRVTFQAMASTRSDLLALTRKLDEALPGKQAGFAKKLAGLADSAMMDAAKNSGIPGLEHSIRQANDLTAETHRMFEQELVKKVVDSKKPEYISRFLLGKSVGLQETADLMRMLPANAKQPLQKQMVLDALRQATNRKTGMFKEKQFADTLMNLGDERGATVFGAKNWQNISDLTKLLERIHGSSEQARGSGASLQNFSVMKNLFLTFAAPLGLASTHGAVAGAQSLAAEWVGLNILADAMTHPEASAKILDYVRKVARAAPYAGTGAVNVGKGQTRVSRDLKAIRDKHVAAMQPAQ